MTWRGWLNLVTFSDHCPVDLPHRGDLNPMRLGLTSSVSGEERPCLLADVFELLVLQDVKDLLFEQVSVAIGVDALEELVESRLLVVLVLAYLTCEVI